MLLGLVPQLPQYIPQAAQPLPYMSHPRHQKATRLRPQSLHSGLSADLPASLAATQGGPSTIVWLLGLMVLMPFFTEIFLHASMPEKELAKVRLMFGNCFGFFGTQRR